MMSVATISHEVNTRQHSALQVVRAALERAAEYDRIQPEAWICRAPEAQVLQQARQVDQRIARGESLPLAGVPIAVKDNIDVAGLETTAGCPAFAYRPQSSAPVIDLLTGAGGIVLGKTNLDQFATGLVGMRSPYGSLGCVFNREFVSGGSSSGSAVVVAAGVVPLALGSDTAGSGRVPAAFNHLVGFKPTRGRWSSRGLVPACRSLDCISLLTHNAADASLVDSVLRQFDRHDPYARRMPPAPHPLGPAFRVGVPSPAQLRDLSMADQRCYRAALLRLSALGGAAREVDVAPLFEAARLLYGGPWVAERTAAVADLLSSNPGAIHPIVRAIVQAGSGITGVETFRGLYALQAYARSAEQLWEQIDVLVLPTTPTIYRRTELNAEPIALNAHLGLYTNFVNLLDMSAVAVPAGFRDDATGAGITLIGPAWADEVLLALADRYLERKPLAEIPPLDLRPRDERHRLAVVGAHLAGQPLHWQLSSREARFVQRARTAACYRLYAMTVENPARPALICADAGGNHIEVEIYELSTEAFGSFTAQVTAPLAIGSIVLEDGSTIHGFVAEPRALKGAREITAFGGWRAYLASAEDRG